MKDEQDSRTEPCACYERQGIDRQNVLLSDFNKTLEMFECVASFFKKGHVEIFLSFTASVETREFPRSSQIEVHQ